MTRSEIIFNYNQAIKQAARLEEIAGNIERIATDKMENSIGMLKNAWRSDNSPQFYSKIGRVQSDIQGDAKSIRKVAQNIRETAERIKQAELRALEIAQTRTY